MDRKHRIFTGIIFLLLALCVRAQVPAGEIKGPYPWHSKIYPGTIRNYWLYIPAQYDPGKAACSMIVQDGLGRANGWKLPAHLDTLIHRKEIPAIVGIFIDPGRVISKDSLNHPRFNRSVEYDGLGDRYARFLIEEIIPEVKKSYNISDDPNDRSIAGASSGAICAFNAAWERPDAFRRVFSTIGTYVGLRGADEMATLIRKTEPKPLRIFLEDGYHDLNIYAGDWYIANQNMLSALTWAGYEVNHAWGEGGHNHTHALTIIADALRWLWKDYPAKVSSHPDRYKGMAITKNQDGWKEVKTPVAYLDRLAADSKGALHFTARDAPGIWKLEDPESASALSGYKSYYSEIAFDAKDQLILCSKNPGGITVPGPTGKATRIPGIKCDKVETTPGGFYFNSGQTSLGYFHYATGKAVYIPTLTKVTGMTVNAEQSFLMVMEDEGLFGSSFRILPDGSLEHGQSYIHFHIPYGYKTAEPRTGVIDTANFQYTATNMGVQVSDPLGRVNMILPVPGNFVSDLVFAGPGFNQLYIISNGKLYCRTLNTRGKPSTSGPIKPPAPRM